MDIDWGTAIPLALAWAAERYMTTRGLKKRVPAQVTGILENLANEAEDRVPSEVKKAIDLYTEAKVKAQIDKALADIAAASERLDASFARASKQAEAVSKGDLAGVAKAAKPRLKK